MRVLGYWKKDEMSSGLGTGGVEVVCRWALHTRDPTSGVYPALKAKEVQGVPIGTIRHVGQTLATQAPHAMIRLRERENVWSVGMIIAGRIEKM
jgi:hypothetical protein